MWTTQLWDNEDNLQRLRQTFKATAKTYDANL